MKVLFVNCDVGAIGRQVALQLAALGVPKLQLVDLTMSSERTSRRKVI